MHILLTGAGFTKNWDGLLASEFQAALVSDARVRGRSRLLELVANTPSFELAYGMTHKSPFDEHDRACLEAAIKDVFAQMDLDHSNIDRLNRIHNTGVCEFISRFCAKANETGYFFTLNQDLLVERIFHPAPVTAPDLWLPGIQVPHGERTFGAWNSQISPKNVTFDPASPPRLDGRFNYIKLHGSSDWMAPGGRAQMVIGTGKEEQIAGNKLLGWYLDVFERVVTSGSASLLTIGYGYRDEHINRIIASACRNNGLRLFAWNAFNTLETIRAALGTDIIPLVANAPLTTLFPPDQSKPAELDRIIQRFFAA